MTLSCEFFRECGYPHTRRLEDGRWIGISNMLFTTGLFVGLDETGYVTRFCYETQGEALDALRSWDGIDDPPGNWIVEKGRGEQRYGPGILSGEDEMI